MGQDEQVLVVKREVIEGVAPFQGLTFDVGPYFEAIFAPGVCRFMRRGDAEEDPRFKQLIPYVILGHEGRYLSYVRGKRAGETRLVGNRSIGIGGHINPEDDAPLLSPDFREAYLTAVDREVEEEIHVETGSTDRIVALLQDESNEVGRVHLGVVHFRSLEAAAVTKREQMITQMGFLTADELRAQRETMETWSQICLDGLAEMESRAAGMPSTAEMLGIEY